ncbi:MAG TPA: response regulator [Thermoanaerobaculia bacterium]|nr:response regulator [Thermoanaerobaculia bacterium]
MEDISKILVVDDDPALLRGYSRILEEAGYAVAQAATGEEALRACAGEMPDLVLLDSVLPDLDGIEVCRRIKTTKALAGVFIVMLSGQRTSGDQQAAGLEAGADGYLAKPIERRALLAHIRALLRIKNAEQAIRASEERQRHLVEELTEANRRLEEYNRLKAEFVANMSHELRTPLTAIIGFAQLVKLSEGDTPLPKSCERAFEKILRNARHLLALIDDVLDIAKIEAGRMKIHREHVDLAEVVQDSFGELQSLARQKGLDYRLRVPEELPLAYIDPLRVRQVVINLLSNAIKFTSRGFVELELVPHGNGWCRLVVRDSGVGIEEQAMGIIFERFRQVDGSMSRLAGGAGLGLSIVRQIVELLGGRIEVASKVGEGSVFSVTLPLTGAVAERTVPDASLRLDPSARPGTEPEAPEPEEETASGFENDRRPLVLIVEDDPDTAALLAETVSAAGYGVRMASSGTAGLRLAREILPDVITLDVMMPGMDGWRVLQALKEEPHTAEIPVIVCSVVDNRPLGYRLGASAYLIKPIEPDSLTTTLTGLHTGHEENGEGYVLVVDDEHGVRELLSTALRKAGYRVLAAASGETALRIVAQSLPRALLCDLMMPGGMSGYELIARLRSDPRTEHVPIMVITGKDMTSEDRLFVLGQITDVIRKGDLLMSGIDTRLREALEHIGVNPSHG